MQDRTGQDRTGRGRQGRDWGWGQWRSLCSYLALAVPRSISSLSHQTRPEWTGGQGCGPVEVRSRSELMGGGEGAVKGHRAVEVIFFTPLLWARVEQPTGSRTGGTFLLRAE